MDFKEAKKILESFYPGEKALIKHFGHEYILSFKLKNKDEYIFEGLSGRFETVITPTTFMEREKFSLEKFEKK